MSRRSRRAGNPKQSRSAGKWAVFLLGVVLTASVVVYGVLRSYLHSDTFRKFLSAETSEMAGVVGEFAPFQWDGLAVDTEAFSASGEGLITGIRASGLHTEVGLGGLERGVWEIHGSSAKRLEISLDTRQVTDQKVKEEVRRTVDKKSQRPAWLPSEAELRTLEIGDLSIHAILQQGPVMANGMRVRAVQSGAKNAYRMEIDGGSLRLPFPKAPELRLDHARMRYQDRQVFLTSFQLDAWDNSRIEGTGDFDLKARQFTLEGDATGLNLENLLSGDWAKRLTGEAESSFMIDNRDGKAAASGQLVIRNGVLTALPVLDALAAYADTRRFRVMTLNDARTQWQWKKNEISFTDLLLTSEGLMRLEGNLVVRGRELDGRFRLGLAPGTLASIPGAETDVFFPGGNGLVWAPLRITGTLDDPSEDLTERLVMAAGIRMLENIPESSEALIKLTNSLLGGGSSKTVEKGVKIIEESSKTVREVSGLLDGIFGSGSSDPAEKLSE